MISLRVEGLNELNGFLRRLPKNLRKEIGKESEQFMKDVQKSAKLRAPRDTGELANSIHVELTGANEWTLFVDSPHGVFQEEGFTPHFIWSDGNNVMGRQSNKFWWTGLHWVSKNKPFVRPALEHNLSKLSQRLNKATQRAIKGGK